MFRNQTQSNPIVWLSYAVQQNCASNFVQVWFLNQLNSVEKIEPSPTQFIRLCLSIRQLNTVQWTSNGLHLIMFANKINFLEQRSFYKVLKTWIIRIDVTWASKILFLIFNTSNQKFRNQTFDLDCPFLWVQFCLIAKLSRTQSMP